jgi:hypothetical protein
VVTQLNFLFLKKFKKKKREKNPATPLAHGVTFVFFAGNGKIVVEGEIG